MRRALYGPPSVSELGGARVVHKFGDWFNPPALTNFYGAVQVCIDIMAIRSLTFPPLSSGETRTALVYEHSVYQAAMGQPIEFTWYLAWIERCMKHQGIQYHSKTTMPLAGRAEQGVMYMA